MNGVTPGSIIGITIKKPKMDEEKINLKVNKSDIELLKMLIEQEKGNLIVELREKDKDENEYFSVSITEEFIDKLDKINSEISEMGSREELERSGLLTELNCLTGLKWDRSLHEAEAYIQILEQLKDAMENLIQNIGNIQEG